MKVLIISHNPMSPRHSIGKALLAMFSEFQPEEICQLYINGYTPKEDVCSSFFRITDKNALKGVFTRKVAGTVVSPAVGEQGAVAQNTQSKKSCSAIKNRMPHRELLRDFIWSISPWYNKALKAWIEKEKPTCIFVAIGSGKFLYHIALKIAKEYNLPIFTYICDDFYSINPPKTLLGPLWKKRIQRKSKELFGKSKVLISIAYELSEFYKKEFEKPTFTIMMGTNYNVSSNIRVKENIKTIRYFGKLTINRYKSIAEIGRVIDEMNQEEKTDYSLEIYCSDIWDEVKREFENIQSVQFYPFITGEEFTKTFFASDALLHVEAFDETSISRVKHSVSTKIADSLASGIPLFAYGPEEVSSIKHLLRNDCGIVVTSKEDLKKKLKMLFSESEKTEEVARQALVAAEKYHNPQKTSQELYNLILGS
ncbi:MAG: glycosyltransferase [Clostridia bacterium]|nr:glycosyltransferase [Clostridia bacterium]